MTFKKLASIAVAALAVTLATGVLATPARADVSFGFFYSNLSPHGNWLVSANYGRVWQPAVYRHGWSPYYDGHWAYSDCGWAWVSDYAWGGIPYHYGTWVDDPYYGWVWVPGYTWAPAWVTFRTGPDYIGWAPVAPGFSFSVWSGGFSGGFSVPASSYVFVPTRYFAAPRPRYYYAPDYRRAAIVNNTTIVNNLRIENNVVVNRGPADLRTIERATRQSFRPERVERVTRATPFERASRQELAVRQGGRVRAAEPVSAQTPLPQLRSSRERREFRSNPQLRDERTRVDRSGGETAQARVWRDRQQSRVDQLQRRSHGQQLERAESRREQRAQVERQPRAYEQRRQEIRQQDRRRSVDEVTPQQLARRERGSQPQQDRQDRAERHSRGNRGHEKAAKSEHGNRGHRR